MAASNHHPQHPIETKPDTSTVEAESVVRPTIEVASLVVSNEKIGIKGLGRAKDWLRRHRTNKHLADAELAIKYGPQVEVDYKPSEHEPGEGYVSEGRIGRRREDSVIRSVGKIHRDLDGPDMVALDQKIATRDEGKGGRRVLITPAIRRTKRRELKRELREGRITRTEYEKERDHLKLGHYTHTGERGPMPKYARRVIRAEHRATPDVMRLRHRLHPARPISTLADIHSQRAEVIDRQAESHGDKSLDLHDEALHRKDVVDTLKRRLWVDETAELPDRGYKPKLRERIRDRRLFKRVETAYDYTKHPLKRTAAGKSVMREITKLRDRSAIDAEIKFHEGEWDRLAETTEQHRSAQEKLRDFDSLSEDVRQAAHEATYEQRLERLQNLVNEYDAEFEDFKHEFEDESDEEGSNKDRKKISLYTYQTVVVKMLAASAELEDLQNGSINMQPYLVSFLPSGGEMAKLELELAELKATYPLIIRNLKPHSREREIAVARLENFDKILEKIEERKQQAIAAEEERGRQALAAEEERAEREARKGYM